MQKVWGYVSAGLFGALLSLALAWKFLGGDDYTIEIKKIKAKRNQGDVVIPIDADQNNKKESGKEKRKNKKQ
jgi:hypothetical protein